MKEIIGRVLALVVSLYLIMITLRIVFSWINLPRGRFINFICRYTDPVLDFFRKNTPIQIGAFDVSIIVPIGILYIIQKIIYDFMLGDHPIAAIINIHYIFEIVLLIVNILVSFIMFLLFIFTIILIVIKIFSPNIYNPLITSISSMISPVVSRIRRMLKLRSKHAEIIYLFIVLGLFIFLSVILGYLISKLTLINHNQLEDFIDSVRNQNAS